MSRTRPRQGGAALITVMMIVALASLALADIVAEQQLDLRRARSREALEQARYVALGAERWAVAVLFEDKRSSDVDSLDEPWATVLPPLPIEGGSVSGYLEDMQARFNLNNLLTAEGQISGTDDQRLRRLLVVLELPPELAQSVVDWIDTDLEPTLPDGAEDDYYSSLERPYRAANRRFTSVSELRLIKGIDAETYALLAPHVSALPGRTDINVNTASATVLRTLGNHIDESLAAQFIAVREEGAFDNVQAFTNHSLHGGEDVPQAGLSVISEYYRARGDVELGPVRLRTLSWLHRAGNGVVRVLMRSRGIE